MIIELSVIHFEDQESPGKIVKCPAFPPILKTSRRRRASFKFSTTIDFGSPRRSRKRPLWLNTIQASGISNRPILYNTVSSIYQRESEMGWMHVVGLCFCRQYEQPKSKRNFAGIEPNANGTDRPCRDQSSSQQHGTGTWRRSDGKHTNALAKETSPYLLLHAHNPVNWYAWNEATLAKAKTEDKPIFLSIGYSSCHWCHVMERESFMDEEIANYLNDNFICIKVDREERPDVDEVYMEALLTWNRVTNSGRGGGWPLSMYLTPDARPFFGGTYFPARTGDRGQSIGFFEITRKIHDFWSTHRENVEQDAALITDLTRKELEGRDHRCRNQAGRELDCPT